MVFILDQISLARGAFSLDSTSNSENSDTQSPGIHHRTDKTEKAGSGSGYADSLLNSTELSRLELTDPDYDFYKKLINLTSNQNLVWHFKHGFDQADPIILYCFDDRPDNPAQLTRFLECEKEFQSFDSLNNQYIKSLIHKLLQLDSVTILPSDVGKSFDDFMVDYEQYFSRVQTYRMIQQQPMIQQRQFFF